MKNAYSIFTTTRLGIDLRVWFTLVILFLIAATVLGFKLATHVDCSSFEISMQGVKAENSNSFYAGETITFTTSIRENQEINWNFGDGTSPQNGSKIQHSYTNDGNYSVTATVNERCLESLTLNIKQFTYKKEPVSTIPNPIIGIETPYAGDNVQYTSSIKANSYEWSILNSQEFRSQTGEKATYTFPFPGNKILELKLDGDKNKVYRKTIQVLPKKIAEKVPVNKPVNTVEDIPLPQIKRPPKITAISPTSGGQGTVVTIIGSYFNEATNVTFGGTPAASFTVISPNTITATIGAGTTGVVSVTTGDGTGAISMFSYVTKSVAVVPPKPPKQKILLIDDQEFKAMFEQVCNGTNDASDFNPYLCDGDKTKVLANNQWKTVASFSELLKDRRKKLLGHKNYSIKSVKTTRDSNKCVTILTIEYN